MYAIVEIAGRQYRVEENQYVHVNRLQAEAGSTITFDNVLLVGKDKKITVGTPNISGASVSAVVEEHGKDKKVIIFKKKRRKGYAVKNGHRHFVTRLKISSIKA